MVRATVQATAMKEYCTLVTHNIASWHPDIRFSAQPDGTTGDVIEGRLQGLIAAGWEVIDACCLPKLSTTDAEPRFAFVLEREKK